MESNTNSPVQATGNSEKNITDNVLNRINQMVAASSLIIPKNYSPENALKAAWFKLLETKTKKDAQGNQYPVLEYCTKDSIANSLLKMVVNAWDPGKNQCYFIPYGKSLSCQGSYFGNKANAKRCGMKDSSTQIVYDGDDFDYEINPETGRIRIIKHSQKIDNIHMDKIKGGYTTMLMDDGTSDVIIMTIDQIKKAWEMGQGEGKTHKNFTDMMAKKTISNRAFRHIINTSDDANLLDEEEEPTIIDAIHKEISENANSVEIGFTEGTGEYTAFIGEEYAKPNNVIENDKVDDFEKQDPLKILGQTKAPF